MSFEIDVSGFDEFAAKMSRLSVVDIAEPVVRKAGVEVKKSMRADASGRRHAPRLAQSISFDVKRAANTIEVQVGPKRDEPTPGYRGKGKGGSLAWYWLGNAKTAPILPHPDRYAKREAEQTVRHLVAALRRALR